MAFILHSHHSIFIHRPHDQVFSFVANFENEPRWVPGVLETERTTSGSVGQGTRYRDVSTIMGRRTENSYEITRYDPPSALSIRSVTGPVSFDFQYRFEPVNEATRVTVVGEFRLTGYLRLIRPILGRLVGKRTEAGLESLKRLLESDRA